MRQLLSGNTRVRGQRVLILSNAVLLLMLAYFAWATVYSSDDYWYSTFWDQGLPHYLELMKYHYQKVNGRVLVHVLAQIVLHFDSWVYALVCCGQCVLVAWIVAKASGIHGAMFHIVLFSFLIGIFCMPLSMFNQGLMWISASCNYLFPTVLVCLLAWSLAADRNWALLLAFLCGATTEQMGFAAVALCAVYAIPALLRRKGVIRCIGSMGLALLSLFTIFYSPGTRERLGKNVIWMTMESRLEIVFKSIMEAADLLSENSAAVVIMIAVLLLGAMLLWRGKGLKWPAAVALFGGTALIFGSIGSDWVSVIGFGIGFVALALFGCLLLFLCGAYSGGLILTALAAAVVMLPTNTMAPRVLMPVYLLLLLAGISLAITQMPENRRITVPVVVLLVGTVLMMVPAMRGYWYNLRVDAMNKSFAREDRENPFVRYCIDYDMDYTWIKADFLYWDENGYQELFRETYLEYIDLPKTTPIRYWSGKEQMKPIQCGDRELVWLTISRDDETTLFPVAEVLVEMGAEVESSEENMTVRLDGTAYELQMSDDDTITVTWTDETGVVRVLQGESTMFKTESYCEGLILEEAFGLQIDQDTQGGYYRISRQCP